MRRTTRLIQTVQLLRRPIITTATDLATRFGVSQRTVYRDIHDLIQAGIPIQGEAGVGYQLRNCSPRFILKDEYFHKDENIVRMPGYASPIPWEPPAMETGLSLTTAMTYIGQSEATKRRLNPMRVPIAKPWFDQREFDAVQEPLESGWVVQGPKVRAFEQVLAQYIGSKDAAACTSGTSALHLCMAALDMGPDDEVIVPSFTFVATANAVTYTQAKPVLVDIDLQTYNLDPKAIKAAITPRTRAIVPVHLFGQAAPMTEIAALAQEHDLAIIEDAACALGTLYNGKHVGALGQLGIFSFHPRKVICTGEGGMVTTNDADLLARLRSLRSHGAATRPAQPDGRTPPFLLGDFDRLGFNYRMTDMQGALGCTQMQKLPAILENRRRLAARYDEKLAHLDWLRVPTVLPNSVHSYQAYVCLFAPEEPNLDNWQRLAAQRNALMMYADDKGVATRQGTQAVHATTYYQEHFGYQLTDMPNSWLAEQLTIALPLYPQMTEQEQDYVVETLIKGFKG